MENEISIADFKKLQHCPQNLEGHTHATPCFVHGVHAKKKTWDTSNFSPLAGFEALCKQKVNSKTEA